MNDYWKEVEAGLRRAHSSPPLPGEPVALGLKIALGASGIALLVTAITAASLTTTFVSTAQMIGTLVGALLWPLLVVGLFSIAPRFRTPPTRALIVLVVWCVLLAGQLSIITVRRKIASLQPASPVPVETRRAPNGTTPPQPRPFLLPAQPAAVPATTVLPVTTPSPYDFSRGSDERLMKLMDRGQTERFHGIAAAYAQACAAQPRNATLALERVRFIERFAHAEDTPLEKADEILEEAEEWLNNRFAGFPAGVLHRLGNLFGPPFDAEANHHRIAVVGWTTDDRAQFFLLRAQRATLERDRRTYAQTSFDAKPSVAAGLMVLQNLPKGPPKPAAARVMEHAIFQEAEPWQKQQFMGILFNAGRDAQALALFRELQASFPALVRNPKTAAQVATAGDIPSARSLLAEAKNPWNSPQALRERFQFELQYGTAEAAAKSYRALRNLGISADPFLRDRVSLLLKHPLAGWHVVDVLGGLMVLLMVALFLVAPAMLLLPVHYWSLLRQRAGKSRGETSARWDLSDAWVAIAGWLMFDFLGLWLVQPEVIRWWTQANANLFTPITPLSDANLLTQQGLVWAGTMAILVWALARNRAWRVLNLRQWTWGQTIGFCLGGVLALRLVLFTHTAIWPALVDGDVASLSSNTGQLCLALLHLLGPLGLIGCIAVLVPVLEELLFRGLLLDALAKHIPFGWANAIQACLFASVHENHQLFLFFVAFGVICGLLARRSGSLLAPILLHSLNNLLVCLVVMNAKQ